MLFKSAHFGQLNGGTAARKLDASLLAATSGGLAATALATDMRTAGDNAALTRSTGLASAIGADALRAQTQSDIVAGRERTIVAV